MNRISKNKICKATVKTVDGVVNFSLLLLLLLLLCYGLYTFWDSHQVIAVADAKQYQIYKPSEEDSRSYEELRSLNSDVFGWLTVYGTNIDYPVVQGQDNARYVYTNAEGEYAMSGAIFLDYRNAQDFSDFNSIFFGHHMAESAMFGDLGNFSDEKYFDERQYGNLYFDGENHGIEFFAFMEVDAFDNSIFSTPVKGETEQQAYLDNIYEKAVYTREMGIRVGDRIVLLSTCTPNSTNGRHLLAGRVVDEVFPVPEQFKEKELKAPQKEVYTTNQSSLWERVQLMPTWIVICIFVCIIVLIVLTLYVWLHKKSINKSIRRKEEADDL